MVCGVDKANRIAMLIDHNCSIFRLGGFEAVTGDLYIPVGGMPTDHNFNLRITINHYRPVAQAMGADRN
jgi:hypothetical protein